MMNDIKQTRNKLLEYLGKCRNLEELSAFEQEHLSRQSGKIARLWKMHAALTSEEDKKVFGKSINYLKEKITASLADKRREFHEQFMASLADAEAIDATQPALPSPERGHLHPNTVVQRELEDLFASMGYMILDGPELESDYFNFGSLNFAPDHPARDSQDTFSIKGHSDWLMRTHTSTMQVRAMRRYGAPLRAVVPGRCFRNEATDARHEHTFYQFEGFMVDCGITFAHMKGVLETVARRLYGERTELRLRPKYYPFVEPGVNGEVSCFLCSGKGCRVCKHSGWLEIFGAGMIHPNVLKEGKIDSKEYQGFAFGLGLTRLVMLKYGIEDVRLLQSGDMRFLEQF